MLKYRAISFPLLLALLAAIIYWPAGGPYLYALIVPLAFAAVVYEVCEMVGRAFVGFVLVPILGYVIICFASPIAWIMADLFLIPAFFYCMKRMKKLLNLS